MNALPIDLKASILNLPANRVASGMDDKRAEDFSLAFRDSLDAIAEKSPPAADEEKPIKEKPRKEVDEKSSRDTAEASQPQPQGQNLPTNVDNLPAKVAEGVPVVVPVVMAEGQVEAAALASGGNLAGVNVGQAATTSLQASGPSLANLPSEAGKPAAVNAQSPVISMAGAPQTPATQSAQISASVVANQTDGAQGVALQALPNMAEGASATEALLQPQRAAQVVLSAAGAPQARVDQQASASPVVASTAGALRVTDDGVVAAEVFGLGAPASTPAPTAPTFADQVLADTLLGTGGQAAAVTVRMPSRPVELPLDVATPLIQVVDEPALPDEVATDLTAADGMVPLGGVSAPVGAAVTSPGASPVSTPAPAPVVMVPAAGLNTEIVKFAGAGGGRAVMEITSPDLGALKIDLSIDGKGVARMVVEATTSAARDQLEQGMRRLHDDFASLGLSLNVDVRQGSSGTAGRESWGQPQYSGGSNTASAAVTERIQSIAPGRGEGSPDDKSRIHFYA